MPQSTTTLLVEDLRRLAAALPAETRLPALEKIVSRGLHRQTVTESPNHLRFSLFGADTGAHIPVAALTQLACHGTVSPESAYWLRADPVTLRADMTRVFMTACGFAGYAAEERAEVTRIVDAVLSNEGIELQATGAGSWCFALPEPLDFEFTPLYAALGVDLAEVLPVGLVAARWKRILTDIQVELHQAGVNERRRDQGLPEVNSVWFWGGGKLPPAFKSPFETVLSDDPVSRGLALRSGCRLAPHDGACAAEGDVLIDWTLSSTDAPREATDLEHRAATLMDSPGRRVELVDGSGQAWSYDRAAARRFWKRLKPLALLHLENTDAA